MRRFGRVFCGLAISVLAGGLAAPPAAGQVLDLWFDEPHDGATWHRGDVIRARIVPVGAIPGADSSRPKLELVVGDKTHEVEGRFYQDGSRAQFYYTVQSDDAAAADEVRMAKVSLGGIVVDLSAFPPPPPPMRSTAAPAALRRPSTASGSARSSCRPAACTVPATRSTGSPGSTRPSR